MKYITVTLNPALDMTLSLPGPLVTDGLNRSERADVSPGGKGINVSRALHALGCESDAVCILGGFTGAKIRSMLTEEGVRVRAIATTADTRINISVLTPENTARGTHCEINNPSFGAREEKPDEKKNDKSPGARPVAETSELLYKTKLLLRRLIHQCEGERAVVVFAGSVPPDMPQNAYAELVRASRAMNAVTVCDCDGDALRHALAAHPDYIKPNLEELSSLTERRLLKDQIPQAATEISVTTGGETSVIATAGPLGAYFAAGLEYCCAPAVKVEHIRSLKGAGDTFLAAFLYAVYEKGFEPAPALAFAARAASKKIAQPGGVFPDLRRT